MDLRQYDTTVEPMGDFNPLPEGDYLVVVADSTEQKTKAGTGSYLELTLEVVDGQYKGRKLWDRLNLNNPNAKAVEIAQRQLAAICRAVGVPRPQDSAELHGIPLVAAVKLREWEGRMQNEVKAYKPASTKAPAQVEQRPGNVPPWQRG